jgi:anaerobic ribonucleoside-triphosphate reductase activating protein
MNEAPPQFEHTASTLYGWLVNTEGIEGVTITGGEPFEQDIETLETFLRLVKSDARQLSVMCYTGKLMTELQNDSNLTGILRYIDILVDGAYTHELNVGHKWRGSSNQGIYPLNASYTDTILEAEKSFDREVEISLSAEMRFELTGIPNDGFMKSLEQKLQEMGYFLSNEE